MENKEFNSILRSIGQQSETGRQLKEYTENVLFHVLKRYSDQNATRFQPYGSAAEDLKCVQPSDIGDVDVVIFPCSENLMVHEDRIDCHTGIAYSKTGLIVVRYTFRMLALLTTALRSTLREYHFLQAFLTL